jgi:hypothetical protein
MVIDNLAMLVELLDYGSHEPGDEDTHFFDQFAR